jgi:hypothetical protein
VPACREMKTHGFKFNINVFKGNKNEPIRHDFRSAEAAGAIASFDALFDAPVIVKKVLCDNAGVNKVYLVASDDDADKVFNGSGCTLVYAPGKRHAKTQSKCAPAAPACHLAELVLLPLKHLCRYSSRLDDFIAWRVHATGVLDRRRCRRGAPRTRSWQSPLVATEANMLCAGTTRRPPGGANV